MRFILSLLALAAGLILIALRSRESVSSPSRGATTSTMASSGGGVLLFSRVSCFRTLREFTSGASDTATS